MTDDFDPTTVPIRPAATVMMVRDDGNDLDAAGIEVFMLRRTASAAFGAGMYVFPGGRVDDADHAAEIAPFCSGLDDATASARLGLDAGGLAYWVAAVRECFEEAGILLATPVDGRPLVVGEHERHAVHEGSLSMVDLARTHQLELDLSNTHYVDHWITPLGEKRRFDTRFFVTESPIDQDGAHDDKETSDSVWIRPEAALDMHRAGELMMMPPTIANLRWLAAQPSAADAIANAAAIENVTCKAPKLRFDDGGKIVGISMPGDADYDDL